MGRHRKVNTIIEKESEVKMTEDVPVMMINDEAALDGIQTEIDLSRKELEKVKMELEETKRILQLSKRDIDPSEAKITEKQITNSNKDKAADDLIAKQKAHDNIPTTGRFINRRAPGNSVKLTYMKYIDDPVKWYPFEDGKVYTIPRGFAEQIKEYYHKPQFTQQEGNMDPDRPTSIIHDVDRSHKLYDFVPVGF